MKRHIVRPRSLVPVVVLAVVAAMCTVSTARAASYASAAPRAASSTQCNFVHSLNTCESTDPTIAYYDSPTGNIVNCTFAFDITWGDGGSTTKSLTDPPAGHNLVGKHTYAGPGVYTITVTVTVTAGTCTAANSTHTFNLPLTKNVTLVSAGKIHVKGHPVPAYTAPAKAHLRGKVAVALLTKACATAVVTTVAVHSVGDLLFVTIAGLSGAEEVLIVIEAPEGWDIFQKCVPIQVKIHKK